MSLDICPLARNTRKIGKMMLCLITKPKFITANWNLFSGKQYSQGIAVTFVVVGLCRVLGPNKL